MSKTIKISEKTYEGLDHYRGKGETFDDAVDKLLYAAAAVSGAAKKLAWPQEVQQT